MKPPAHPFQLKPSACSFEDQTHICCQIAFEATDDRPEFSPNLCSYTLLQFTRIQIGIIEGETISQDMRSLRGILKRRNLNLAKNLLNIDIVRSRVSLVWPSSISDIPFQNQRKIPV
ncbi:hypothetical protein DOM22_04245 [Bdellovibrio sp. ZAP7]|nr:hypothetical protein DOM22_04245 [Bdellovibrio sp. ZAP7]